MNLIRVSLIGLYLLCSFNSLAQQLPSSSPAKEAESLNKKREPKFYYRYRDRKHSTRASFNHLAALYGVSWALYPITQPRVFKNKGSFDNYKYNFGRMVFDNDEPFWNWIIHPLSGSQLYLYFRANGYSKIESLSMTFINSALFEFTVEIYTEPASVQDLFQTPVIGSIIGYGIENLSMYLLNSGNVLGKFFGHLINPATLFWFYEGKIQITPTYNGKDKTGLSVMVGF